jgi:glutamine synthetase
MVEHLLSVDIPVKYHHHEVGSAGQCEIEIEPLPLLEATDAVMLTKYVVKMTALKAGKTATFMPKPLTDEAGTGMHFHQVLFKGDVPVFSDPDKHAGLSDIARYYIGGLLTHAPALLALTNPTTNSYKRLQPGFEAPTRIFFGIANRSASVRIPKHTNIHKEKDIEFRSPDGTCNPYLAIAGQLLAGIDGVKQKIDPTDAGFGPFDFNIFELSPAEQQNIPSLPFSLEQALRAIEEDHDFLMLGEVFPEDFVQTWVKYKMEHDVIPLQKRTHPFEIELYYDV